MKSRLVRERTKGEQGGLGNGRAKGRQLAVFASFLHALVTICLSKTSSVGALRAFDPGSQGYGDVVADGHAADALRLAPLSQIVASLKIVVLTAVSEGRLARQRGAR